VAGGAAFALLMLAAWLLLRAGLPQRSDYTGVDVAAIGRVAPEIGALAPPIDAPTLNGDRVNLQALRGGSVVINFWATWCVPCRREMPDLQSLHEETGVPVLAVNLAESPPVVQQWVDEFALTLTVVLDSRGRIAEQYRLRGQPTTYVVAPDGIITHIYYGATTDDILHAALLTHTGDNDA
jgi:thiol-disulfide isomerase/thioredoxin